MNVLSKMPPFVKRIATAETVWVVTNAFANQDILQWTSMGPKFAKVSSTMNVLLLPSKTQYYFLQLFSGLYISWTFNVQLKRTFSFPSFLTIFRGGFSFTLLWIRSDEGLTLETSAFRIPIQCHAIYIINR